MVVMGVVVQLTAPSLAERYVPSGIILAAFYHVVSVSGSDSDSG
jgi:hypothetical protein